jgi:uncharacterized protein (DUF2141 family)
MSRRLLAVAICASIGSASAEPAKLAISGRVVNAADDKTVYVALWDAGGFLDKPVRQIKLAPKTARTFRFEVAPGRWAVSAFEDRNDNGVLDMGLFGPKEPSGFWRAFHAWRKPRFDDVASQIDRDVGDAEVALR